MSDKIKVRNYLALACLIFAKISGVLGITLAYMSLPTLGACLLALDGALLLLAVILCLLNGKTVNEEEDLEKEMLRRLLKEGRLRSQLKEIGYR